ncbi:MAG: hypothetical protein C4560_09585 [Nitrospiraceae bacterium]|nr:MAG: hypothetical protein C4560_09585 [Nitrospiraceae bacterium]
MDDKVVITGTGIVTSLGTETWASLLAGGKGIRTVEGFDVSSFNCKAAAQVHGLDSSAVGVHPRDARIMDRHSLMLMKAARAAFSHAKLDAAYVPGEEMGFFTGMGMVDYNIGDLLPAILKSLGPQGSLDYKAFFSGAYREVYPLWPLSMLNNISFCQVAIDLGIKGENAVFSPHADSGAHAIIEGANSLIEKKALAVLAGGVSEKVSPSSMSRASWYGILTEGQRGDYTCRPFSEERNGTILGEGCGIVALELLSSAKKRSAPCLAALTGYSCSFGKSREFNGPASEAISRAMEGALAKAGLKPADIDLIIAHGDGTRDGDKNEIGAIHQTFSDRINKVNVFSSKGALGHMLAGAPAVDVVLGIHMLQNGIIPAVVNAGPLDGNVRFNVPCRGPVKRDIKRILINAHSYEGQCVSLIIEAVE